MSVCLTHIESEREREFSFGVNSYGMSFSFAVEKQSRD